MNALTLLFRELDATTRTLAKLAALDRYFRAAPPADAAWTLWFLLGNRLRRRVKTAILRRWAAEAANLPLWLVEECYKTVGDLAETLALLLPTVPEGCSVEVPVLHELIESRLLPLSSMDENSAGESLRETWSWMDTHQRLVWNKLITGAFRVGISKLLLVKVLAELAKVPPPVMEHRLLGSWKPTEEDYRRLLSAPAAHQVEPAQPYPFCLASPLDGTPEALGFLQDWQIEWKWDGIRAQLIRRGGQTVLWSRGEEIITAPFPEIVEAAESLPSGTVLDGQILAWCEGRPMPLSDLQRRLQRKSASAKLRRDIPCIFLAYDLLEAGGLDLREQSLRERRKRLEEILADRDQPAPWEQGELFGQAWRNVPAAMTEARLQASPVLNVESWQGLASLRETARNMGTEGLMLKLGSSTYRPGRHRGAWWKWKLDPFTSDMVLVAAQPGHGRQASLFTDYTFAIWQGSELVTVAKANSGLTDEEISAVDAFVRQNTIGKFGPVRSVKPELVFEVAFEGIALSPRHKSGVVLRFPRILRQRPDKNAAEADSVESLNGLLRLLRGCPRSGGSVTEKSAGCS